MNYPLISEYVEAIKLAEDNLDQLSHLRPVLDADGRPVMSSGNFAVVFKMRDEQDGKFYAIKCFTREQEGRKRAYQQISNTLKGISSPYLVSIRYLENELFVNSKNNADTEFPVVVMDWVNGKTLDNYIKSIRFNQEQMKQLSLQFFKLAEWLLKQPIAHGDLKPDNILVREDGSLVLVDYDGMFVPAMAGQQAREIGSPNFRLPNRDINTFDRNIDDFPITTISLALRAITLNPDLLDEFNAKDALLFVEDDFHNIAGCKLYHKLCTMISDNGINQLILALHLSFTGVPIGDAYLKIIGADRGTTYGNYHGSSRVNDKLNELINAAENDDIEAMKQLAKRYVQTDFNEAINWFQKAANQGDIESYYYLGIISHCLGKDKDAIELLTQAAEKGYAGAQYVIATFYYDGIGVKKSFWKAVEWYELAADQGHAQAQYNLGIIRNLDKSTAEGRNWFLKAAKQGHVLAQYHLGESFFHGYYFYNHGYIGKDNEQAIKWLSIAVEGNCSMAMTSLGDVYFNDDKYEEAVQWYRKAARFGNSMALRNLAYCYENGFGVEKNDAESNRLSQQAKEIEQKEKFAVRRNDEDLDRNYEYISTWYRKLAEQGSAPSQYLYGMCLYEGNGVEKDEETALEYLSQSANNGYTKAQVELGLIKSKISDSKAIKWFKRAAELGDSAGQFYYGDCFYRGRGVNKNMAEAVKWFLKSAEQGFMLAQEQLIFCYDNGFGVAVNTQEADKWMQRMRSEHLDELRDRF